MDFVLNKLRMKMVTNSDGRGVFSGMMVMVRMGKLAGVLTLVHQSRNLQGDSAHVAYLQRFLPTPANAEYIEILNLFPIDFPLLMAPGAPKPISYWFSFSFEKEI